MHRSSSKIPKFVSRAFSFCRCLEEPERHLASVVHAGEALTPARSAFAKEHNGLCGESALRCRSHCVCARLASTFSPNGTNSCGNVLPCNLSNGVRPSHPSGTWTKCSPHVPPTTAVQLSTWHLMVLMAPRTNITAFPTNPFESFVSIDRVLQRDVCFVILSHTISERDHCWLHVAFQRDLLVP